MSPCQEVGIFYHVFPERAAAPLARKPDDGDLSVVADRPAVEAVLQRDDGDARPHLGADECLAPGTRVVGKLRLRDVDDVERTPVA
jgi:hypothetical protein